MYVCGLLHTLPSQSSSISFRMHAVVATRTVLVLVPYLYDILFLCTFPICPMQICDKKYSSRTRRRWSYRGAATARILFITRQCDCLLVNQHYCTVRLM